MKIPAFDPERRLWSSSYGFHNDCQVFTIFEDGAALIHAYRTWNRPNERTYYPAFDVTIRYSRDANYPPNYALTDPDGTRLKKSWLQENNQILVYDHQQKRVVRGDGSGLRSSRPDADFLQSIGINHTSVYAASPDAPLLGYPVELHAPQTTPPSERKRAMEFIQACKTWAHLCDDVIKVNGKPIHLKEILRREQPPNTRTQAQNYAVYNFTAETFQIYPDLTFNDLTPLERLAIVRKGKCTYPHKTTTLPYLLIA